MLGNGFGYVVGEILLCLLLAALIGFLAAWFLKRRAWQQREAEYNQRLEIHRGELATLQTRIVGENQKLLAAEASAARLRDRGQALESDLAARDGKIAVLEPLQDVGANVARQARVSSSGDHDAGAAPVTLVNDGLADFRRNDQRWLSRPETPNWIEFRWDAPQTIAAGTRKWCSGPCIFTAGWRMSAVASATGSVPLCSRQARSMTSAAEPAWQASQT